MVFRGSPLLSVIALEVCRTPILCLRWGTGGRELYKLFSVHVPFVVVGIVALPVAIPVSLRWTHKMCVVSVSVSKNAVSIMFAEQCPMSKACSFG